jgi:hypothetical protein
MTVLTASKATVISQQREVSDKALLFVGSQIKFRFPAT